MTVLTLEQASQIVDAGLARAIELKFRPMTIAVLDAGGHLVAFKRQDRSGILRPEIAQGKAWGALGMGHGGRDPARPAIQAPAFYAAIAATARGCAGAIGGPARGAARAGARFPPLKAGYTREGRR